MTNSGTHKHRTRTPRGAASPTSSRRLEALGKQRQALAMRIAGASFDEIADALGYADRGGAHKAIMAAIERTLPESAAQVRKLELKRLDRLWLAVWDAATKGDLQAVDACLRIMKRRADFEGLDKAKKHDLQHSGGARLVIVEEIVDAAPSAKDNPPAGEPKPDS
jgi:hypothetical protein